MKKTLIALLVIAVIAVAVIYTQKNKEKAVDPFVNTPVSIKDAYTTTKEKYGSGIVALCTQGEEVVYYIAGSNDEGGEESFFTANGDFIESTTYSDEEATLSEESLSYRLFIEPFTCEAIVE